MPADCALVPSRPTVGQRGASLLEALIGVMVVAVGMLATAQWQARLRQAADLARQQAGAARVAQQELEVLRGFAQRQTAPDLASYDAVGAATRSLDGAAGGSTRYTVDRQVQAQLGSVMKALTVRVDWPDTRGATRSLQLDGVITGQAPALALALARAPAGRDATPLLGRHVAIPRTAGDLPDGRTVFKPLAGGDEAWLFDRRTGRIVGQCDGVPTGKGSQQLVADDLASCRAADALLTGGRVRFALSASPDASAANDSPLPLSVSLALASHGHPAAPHCVGEAVKTVLIGTSMSGPTRAFSVPADATPASQGVATWTELGDRHWQFHCMVPPAPASGNVEAPHWSGRLQFTPLGWTLGTVVGARRVCRYSADTDASGAIDRPAENPDSPSGVSTALTELNFLVVDGLQDCPSRAAASTAAGTLPWSHANPATVPHQP